MSIYKSIRQNTRIHQNIYKKHYGLIPKDENGRSFEIHHKDGDHTNNDPTNLIAISIQEHYNIHYDQGDWAACQAISLRMNMSPDELSNIIRELNLKRVNDGTHHFLGPNLNLKNNAKRVNDGTHHFLGPSNNQAMLDAGIHPFQNKEIQSQNARKSIEKGTNKLVGGSLQKEHQRQLLSKGIHNSQIKIKCEYCEKTISKLNFHRWHGDNCKFRNNKI
jgi:hypothetical protein